MPTTRRTQILTATVLLTCAIGCGRNGSFGTAIRDAAWANSAKEATPGIDQASVSVINMKAGPVKGVSFVIWCDSSSGFRDGKGTSGQGVSVFTCQIVAVGGTNIPLAARTTDGETGTVTIGDVTYRLENGAAFLISTREEELTISQIDLDPDTVPNDTDSIVELARSTVAIKAFFEGQKQATKVDEITKPAD